MRFAVYDTGHHYLVARLRRGNPVQGLLVDKWGSVRQDLAAFDGGRVKPGSVKMDLRNTAKLAAGGTFMAELEDGEVVRYSADALDDEGFCGYAGIQP